jgi:hypothetical protein
VDFENSAEGETLSSDSPKPPLVPNAHEMNLRKPGELLVQTPNYIHDLIVWQWTASNPATFPTPLNVRPPSPSLAAAKGQQLLSSVHHLDPAFPGLDPLVHRPPILPPFSCHLASTGSSSWAAPDSRFDSPSE